MKIEYWAGSDMLNIHLVERPSIESEEVADDFVFDYDEQGRVVCIEVANASERVDLSEIKKQAVVIQDSMEPVEIFSVREVADQLGVGVRAIQKTLKQMADAGQAVGKRTGQTSSIYLWADQVEPVKQWRAQHRLGRPRKEDVLGW